MPFLIPEPPPQAAVTRSIWDVEEAAVPLGLEGRQLREQLENVRRHWQQQSMATQATAPPELLEELSRYQHPPFEFVGKVRVRFLKITDLQPRQFVFDEEDE